MEKKRVGYFVLFYTMCIAILTVLIVCIKTGIGTGISADVKAGLITAALKADSIGDAVSKAGDKITGIGSGIIDSAGAQTTSGDAAKSEGILSSVSDIGLYDTDGAGKNYSFTYGGETFRAYFDGESWTIYDSYRVKP